MRAVEEIALQVEELETRLEAQKAQLLDLATMGAVITGIHDIDAVLSVVMDMAIRLVDGEVGLILIKENDKFCAKISWGASEQVVNSLLTENGEPLVDYCFETGTSAILTDLQKRTPEGLLLNSVLVMPIRTSEKTLGVLAIINKAAGGDFRSSDQEALEMLLNFVAVAVDNSLLMKERLERQKMEQEMAIARQVQETILPQDAVKVAGAEIGAVYFPARAVGGDFYDVIKLDEQMFIVIIGDVSNKGVPAALVMSAVSGIIKSTVAANQVITMDELASSLNEILAREFIKDREMFVTLLFAKFDLMRQTLTYCNAGHLPGLLWQDSSQSIVTLSTTGPIVGQFPGTSFKQMEQPITSGDRLFLFTDGLTEAMDSESNLFGRERAEQVFAAEIDLAPKQFCLRVKEWVDTFTQGASEDSHDDFTILQVRVE